MQISEYVRNAIDDFEAGKLESALLQACIGVDATGRRSLPGLGVRDRFVGTLEAYNWVVEPMLATGVNLEETTWEWVHPRREATSFAGLVYDVWRTNLAHGDQVPAGHGISVRVSESVRSLKLSEGTLELPDAIIFALLAVVVFARVNADQQIGSPYHLSHGDAEFVIDEWWGREDDALEYFSIHQLPRVTLRWN